MPVYRDIDLDRANLSTLLRFPYQAFIDEIHRRLALAGYPDITPAHGAVFQHLRAEGSRLTELAERAQLAKQSIAYLVDTLERHGYVERVDDPHDGRARLVRMTAKGWELTRVAEGIISDIEAAWAVRFGPDRLTALRAALTDLIGTLPNI